MNYYNEHDPHAAQWLRQLIADGQIPHGVVDTRSIIDVRPADLLGFTQCHFFAGIGGWPLALRLAQWRDDRKLWTGSCPCQPWSGAGKGLGANDERHLWPAFYDLIRECQPELVFGEQVASAIKKHWLDGISADLERAGYACGAVVLGAHSVGAPHIRQRLYWVADSQRARWEGTERAGQTGEQGPSGRHSGKLRGPCGLAVTESEQPHGSGNARGGRGEPANSGGRSDPDNRLGDSQSGGRGEQRNATQPGSCRHAYSPGWSGFDIIQCRDGKARRVEAGTFPLAPGLPGRMGLLRGYGNAIVPQTGAIFLEAFEAEALIADSR